MVELKVTAPGQAELLADGAPAGECRWTWGILRWGAERVKVAQVERFTAPEDRRADFWAYLTFLFQRDGAAAATLNGTYFWFSQALQKSWEAAGRPETVSQEEVPYAPIP